MPGSLFTAYTCPTLLPHAFLLSPLYKPLLHGTYIDDVFFGLVFVVMVAVFLYFYFSDKGETDAEDEGNLAPSSSESDASHDKNTPPA